MAEMATVGKIQTHEPVVRPHDGLVYLQICRAAAQSLHIDAPPLLVKSERLESAGLASQLNGIDVLIASIVASAGQAFAVLVAHRCAKCIEDRSRGEVLGCDQVDGFSLPLDLVFLQPLSPSPDRMA